MKVSKLLGIFGCALIFAGAGCQSISFPPQAGSSAPAPTVAGTSSNIFSLSTSKVGDRFGQFQLKSVQRFSAGGTLSPDNMSATFSGQATISGVYDPGAQNPSGVNIPFFSITDLKELAKLPILAGRASSAIFYFRDPQTASTLLGSTSGKATIMIQNYTISNAASNIVNTTDLVSVVSKQ